VVWAVAVVELERADLSCKGETLDEALDDACDMCMSQLPCPSGRRRVVCLCCWGRCQVLAAVQQVLNSPRAFNQSRRAPAVWRALSLNKPALNCQIEGGRETERGTSIDEEDSRLCYTCHKLPTSVSSSLLPPAPANGLTCDVPILYLAVSLLSLVCSLSWPIPLLHFSSLYPVLPH
jgi:hypothetical protein